MEGVLIGIGLCDAAAPSAPATINLNGPAAYASVAPQSGYTGGSACNTAPVIFYANTNVGCPSTYFWNVPPSWSKLGQTGNSITLQPSGTPADEADINVTITYSCGSSVTSGNFRPAFNDPVISSPPAICYASSCGTGSRITLSNVQPNAVVNWSVGGNMTILCGQGTSSMEVSALSSTTVEAGAINATIDCPGVTVQQKAVWVGKPKPPGTLDKSLSPICPGEIKTGQFSSPPQGFATLELINPYANFEVHGGYTYLTVEAFYPVSESTSFTHRQTNACGIKDVKYFVKVLDYSDTRCGGSGSLSTVQVYPNPAVNEVTVTSDTGEEEKQVTLLSDANEQLFQTRASTKEIKIPVSSFRAGIYYIQVESQSEGVVKKQLVIKR